jgi:hypothetical protein
MITGKPNKGHNRTELSHTKTSSREKLELNYLELNSGRLSLQLEEQGWTTSALLKEDQQWGYQNDHIYEDDIVTSRINEPRVCRHILKGLRHLLLLYIPQQKMRTSVLI